MMRIAVPVIMALSLGLGACGGGIPGLGGESRPSAPGQESQGVGTSARNLFLFGTSEPPPIQPQKVDEKEKTCPAIDIIENAAGYRGAGSGGSASGVSFQASITNTARECIFEGNQLRLRVGIEGRVLLGPNGKAGSYSVPVRVVIKRRKDNVTQRSARVNVTIPGSDTQAEFSHIEENIVLPITQFDPGDEYDILVGLDASGSQAQRSTRRR
ncbi:MAG: hypothetical protein ACRCWF_08170 [Beijerinckiaceae bacterium]